MQETFGGLAPLTSLLLLLSTFPYASPRKGITYRALKARCACCLHTSMQDTPHVLNTWGRTNYFTSFKLRNHPPQESLHYPGLALFYVMALTSPTIITCLIDLRVCIRIKSVSYVYFLSELFFLILYTPCCKA